MWSTCWFNCKPLNRASRNQRDFDAVAPGSCPLSTWARHASRRASPRPPRKPPELGVSCPGCGGKRLAGWVRESAHPPEGRIRRPLRWECKTTFAGGSHRPRRANQAPTPAVTSIFSTFTSSAGKMFNAGLSAAFYSYDSLTFEECL